MYPLMILTRRVYDHIHQFLVKTNGQTDTFEDVLMLDVKGPHVPRE